MMESMPPNTPSPGTSMASSPVIIIGFIRGRTKRFKSTEYTGTS